MLTNDANLLSFRDLANEWLLQKQVSVKKSTYVKYLNSLNKHILPEIGELTLSEINNRKIIDFVNRKLNASQFKASPNLSNKTVKDILLIVNSIMKYGQCYYGNVPTINIAYPPVHKREIRILSHMEQRALEEILYQDMDCTKLGILITLYTGLRLGEICGLRWEDISLFEGTLCVKRTVQRLQTFDIRDKRKTTIIIDSPKTSNSIRKIPLPDFLISIIKKYSSDNQKIYILSGKTDECMEPRTLENKFHIYLSQALALCMCNPQYSPQAGNLTFHSLRHTFATRCAESGFEIKCLSEILGHSNVNITLNRYVHSSIQMKRENMKKLENTYADVSL